MKHYVVAIFDSAVKAYGQPFFTPAPGAALRAFMDEINRPDTPLNKHPDDYELFLLATFDDNTGNFTPEQSPLARGKDVKQPPPSVGGIMDKY